MRDRLIYELASAGVPVDKVPAVVGPGLTRDDLTFMPGITQSQLDTCDTILAAFDWSQSAHDAWTAARLRAVDATGLDDSAGAARILRALVSVLLDEVNALRGQIVGTATAVWDPANMANGTGTTSPGVTVTGAAFGDSVDVCAPYSLQGVVATGYVSATDTVNVRLHNSTGGAVNLASGTWKVVVRRHTAMPGRTLAQARTAIVNAINNGDAD